MVQDTLSRIVPVFEIQKVSIDPWYISLVNKCKQFPTSCPNYVIKNNKLFRYSKNKFSTSGDYDWKQVVSTDRREDILKSQHCSELVPHFGIFKTYKWLALSYYCPDLYKDVVKFVNSCELCSAYKLRS